MPPTSAESGARTLEAGAREGTLNVEEMTLAKKFAKAVKHLQANPFHPGLSSHEIDDMTKRYSQKVFESYLENNTPGDRRMFWVYGPERGQSSVIGLEPHRRTRRTERTSESSCQSGRRPRNEMPKSVPPRKPREQRAPHVQVSNHRRSIPGEGVSARARRRVSGSSSALRAICAPPTLHFCAEAAERFWSRPCRNRALLRMFTIVRDAVATYRGWHVGGSGTKLGFKKGELKDDRKIRQRVQAVVGARGCTTRRLRV